jgi:zinc transporter ZupT
MQLFLSAGAAMTCAAISYFTTVLGALVGFFVASIFRAGGRS